MFRKLLLTFSSRLIASVLSVINVLIGTNTLGVEGYGTISLTILGITLYLMIQNVITGISIVYFAPRIRTSSILFISYAWALAAIVLFSGLAFAILNIGPLTELGFEIVPRGYEAENIAMALTYGLLSIHLNLMLGRENIRAYNFITILQHFSSTFLLVVFFYLLDKDTIGYYLLSLFLSYALSFTVALLMTLRYLERPVLPSPGDFASLLRYGAMGQSANAFQFFNYRLGYYLIDAFAGRGSLGIFSAATQVSEGLWIFSKSISVVLLSRISNLGDRLKAALLTLKLIKFTTLLTAIPLLLLLVMPESFYTAILGASFSEVRTVLRWMAPGTISLAASHMLSSYFSGSGRIQRNTAGSGIGMAVTVVFALALIPWLGNKGAAISNSLSYLASLCYLLYQFRKEAVFSLSDLIVSRSDIIDSLKLIPLNFGRKSGKAIRQ